MIAKDIDAVYMLFDILTQTFNFSCTCQRRSATYIFVILNPNVYTVCKKCIHDKIIQEDAHSCPVCNRSLGCSPLDKLRYILLFPLYLSIISSLYCPGYSHRSGHGHKGA